LLNLFWQNYSIFNNLWTIHRSKHYQTTPSEPLPIHSLKASQWYQEHGVGASWFWEILMPQTNNTNKQTTFLRIWLVLSQGFF
jgi:hypothetical protein